MKHYTILDPTGFELFGVFTDTPPEGNHTDVPRTAPFARPRFNGSEWEEGGTAEEVQKWIEEQS